MVIAHYVLDSYGKRQTEYIILIAFPLQQWLHERASMLRNTNIAVLFNSLFLSRMVDVITDPGRHKA